MSTTGSAKVRRLHTRIFAQLESCLELTRDASLLTLFCAPVSQWSIAQHLEHLALVDHSILAKLEQPEEDLPKGSGPTINGRLMLALGWIPRGAGKAPAFVNPRQTELDAIAPKLIEVERRLQELGNDLGRLETATPLAKHFAFGYLNGSRWLRFIGMHHHHHWKIIREIRRKA